MKLIRDSQGVRRDPWDIQSSRVLVLTYLTLLLTALLGALAMTVTLTNDGGWSELLSAEVLMVPVAGVIGLLVSVANVPVLLFCVRRKRLWLSLPIIFTVATVAVLWYIAEPFTWGRGYYPLTSAIVAIVAIHMTAVACEFVLPDDPRLATRGVCPACGYNLRGARTPGCPECGWGRGDENEPRP